MNPQLEWHALAVSMPIKRTWFRIRPKNFTVKKYLLYALTFPAVRVEISKLEKVR